MQKTFTFEDFSLAGNFAVPKTRQVFPESLKKYEKYLLETQKHMSMCHIHLQNLF